MNVVKRVESFVDVDTVVIAVNWGDGDDNNNVSFSASPFNDEENDGVRFGAAILSVKHNLRRCRC